MLCLASYIDGDYTIVNENKTVGMKIRAGNYENTEVIPIKNAAVMKRFEDHIRVIEECYYSADSTEETRNHTSIDAFRHSFYPDDVRAILFSQNYNPEQVWVRLKAHIGCKDNLDGFVGQLLNTPFEKGYGLSSGDEVLVAVVTNSDEDLCFVVLK